MDDNILDPGEFRVAARDTHGHTERVWCNIQPRYSHQMSVVLNSRAFPYRSREEIIRHAIKRHLELLDRLYPLPSVMKQADLINDMLREEELHEEFVSTLQRLRTMVQKHAQEGQMGRARYLVAMARTRIEDMPEGGWKDRYTQELKGYDYLFSGDNMSLVDAAEGKMPPEAFVPS